jgi:hypothetical protein
MYIRTGRFNVHLLDLNVYVAGVVTHDRSGPDKSGVDDSFCDFGEKNDAFIENHSFDQIFAKTQQ